MEDPPLGAPQDGQDGPIRVTLPPFRVATGGRRPFRPRPPVRLSVAVGLVAAGRSPPTEVLANARGAVVGRVDDALHAAQDATPEVTVVMAARGDGVHAAIAVRPTARHAPSRPAPPREAPAQTVGVPPMGVVAAVVRPPDGPPPRVGHEGPGGRPPVVVRRVAPATRPAGHVTFRVASPRLAPA